MHAPIRFVSVAVLSLIGFGYSANAHGSNISSASLSGPGGTASLPNFFSGTTNISPQVNYTSMEYVDLTLQIDTVGNYETFLLTQLLNNTGESWGGFKWNIVSGPGLFLPDFPAGPGNFDFTTNWPYDVTDTQVFFHGAPFLSGSSSTGLVPIVNFTVTEPGTVVMRMTPVGVPEPGSVILFVIGAVAIGFVRTWRGRPQNRPRAA